MPMENTPQKKKVSPEQFRKWLAHPDTTEKLRRTREAIKAENERHAKTKAGRDEEERYAKSKKAS